MKRRWATLAALIAAQAVGHAQGTFSLSSAKGAKPKVYLHDLETPAAGSNYAVDVRVLNPASGNFETPLKGEAPVSPVALFSGANAGLFSGGTITVPFVVPGADATIKILVWDKTTGATFADASVVGIAGSTTFVIKLGGVVDPGTGIPSLPSDIVPAYTGLVLNPVVPEPSSTALAVLGVGVLIFLRRK